MVMSMAVTLAAARGRRFSIPDESGHLFRRSRHIPAVASAAWHRLATGHPDQRDEAVAMEQELAGRLRNRGYTVYGGQ